MGHDNRSQVHVPRRLLDEMMLALDQALARIEILDSDPSIVTRQVHDFGQRVLTEARKRLADEIGPDTDYRDSYHHRGREVSLDELREIALHQDHKQ
jgi:hypothetical protein